MADPKAGAADLVMTQAELPPAVEAASPADARRWSSGPAAHTATLQEVRRLADQVGGLDRLRQLIDELAAAGD